MKTDHTEELEQFATVPVERSYDMRAAAIIQFNTARQGGADVDDALEAAWRAMLAKAHQPDCRATPADHQHIAAMEAENERLRETERALIYNHNLHVEKLEAARGLLERAATCMRDAAFIIDSSSYRINGAAATIYSLRTLAAELTATQAPEVQQFVKPSLLKECNVTYSNSSSPLAEQGERQEAQVMGRVHHGAIEGEPVRAVLNSIGRQLPDNAPLYAEPQPGPDVRGLVEALERIADARETPTLGDPNVLRVIAFQALAAHRQAQRQA